MTKTINVLATLFFTVFLSTQIGAQEYEGKFQLIQPNQPTQTGDKIEVIEVFWYGCPHCYAFEPYIEKWLETKADDVEFIRIPGVLNQNWVPQSKAYYVAEKLGVVDKIHKPLFDAIHKDKKPLYTEAELEKFFTSHGVSKDEFRKIFNSNELDIKIRQAYFTARNYKLTGVPSVMVNGKYLTTATLAKSFDSLIEVIDYLVEQERKTGN